MFTSLNKSKNFYSTYKHYWESTKVVKVFLILDKDTRRIWFDDTVIVKLNEKNTN